jgi:hypothetical protein
MFRQQPPHHLPRHLLFAVLAYRLQATQLGDLDPATARLLRQIATGGRQDQAPSSIEWTNNRGHPVHPWTMAHTAAKRLAI